MRVLEKRTIKITGLVRGLAQTTDFTKARARTKTLSGPALPCRKCGSLSKRFLFQREGEHAASE